MNELDEVGFRKMWAATCEMCSGKVPTDMAITLAFAALKNREFSDVSRALQAHIQNPDTGMFNPKPADIIRHIDGDGESAALRAWSMVEQAISEVGPYQSVVFDSPAAMRTIEDMGGWIQLCNVSYDELPFRKNEFAKRFQGYRNIKPLTWPNKLKGLAELHNASTVTEDGMSLSRFIPEPVLIGNQRHALAVYQRGGGDHKALETGKASILIENTAKRLAA